MNIQPGQELLHYRLVEKLGEGGMGVVWKAVDTTLDREVAIKILPEAFSSDPERLARFEREAKTLASLNHPNIAAVYSVHEADGLRFLAMELVRGENLAARLARGALPIQEALGVALQITEGLEAAHDSGIVHRDLKPGNVLLTEQGQVKVLDFGLAKSSEARSSGGTSLDNSPTVTSLGTVAGVILGTAAYMSPEQARGKPVDRRTDIWAFGCVVFELLTGLGPFRGETVTDVLGAIMHREPDWGALPPQTPPGLRRLLRRCLRRDERQRLRDIGDARILIEEALAGEAEAAPAVAGRASVPRRMALIVGGTALVASVLGGALGWLSRQPAHQPLPQRRFALPLSDVRDPVISPDGKHLVYVSQDRLWLRDLAEVEARAIAETDGATKPFWSPDGEWIGFARERNIEKIARSGGQPNLITVNPPDLVIGSGAATWGADGRIVFSTARGGLYQVPVRGGESTVLLEPGPDDTDFHEVTGLPGDRGWVFNVHTKELGTRAIDLLLPDGTRKNLVLVDSGTVGHPWYASTGHLLYNRSGSARGIWAVPFSADRSEVEGDPFLVAPAGAHASVAGDGTLAYIRGSSPRRSRLLWVDRQGNTLGPIGDPLVMLYPFPSLSSDDKQLLVTGGGVDAREIWLYDTTSGLRRQVTFAEGKFDMVRWHPDGRHALAYDILRGYTMHLLPIDGSSAGKELGHGIMAEATADGTRLLYAALQPGGFNWDIHMRPLNGDTSASTPLVVGDGTQWAPLLSPDERFLLYTSNETGRDEIMVTSFPDADRSWRISTDGGMWGRWRSDGKEIFYAKGDAILAVEVDPRTALPRATPRVLLRRPVTGWSSTWTDGFAVAADGQRFVVAENVEDEDSVPPALIIVQNWTAGLED